MNMKIIEINVAEKSVKIEYAGKERLVTFSDSGDIDVEPFGDLSDGESEVLFDSILNSEEINCAIPFED